MEELTWIGLPRFFTKASFYKDSRCVLLFSYLLLKANRDDNWFGNNITKRGEYRTTITQLEQLLGMSRQILRVSLKKLEEERAIHIESEKKKGSLITVMNFDKYLKPFNSTEGWLKLYDDFTAQKWFFTPTFFHLYLHISLKMIQDQIYEEIPSWLEVGNLANDTGIPLLEIKRGMQKMVKLGLIVLTYNNKYASQVLLPAYSTYKHNRKQTLEAISSGAKLLNVTGNDNHKTTITEPKKNQIKVVENFNNNIRDVSVNNYITTTYNTLQPLSNQKRTIIEPNKSCRECVENALSDNLSRARVKEVYNQIEVSNENKRENKNINSSSVRMCEENFSQSLLENLLWVQTFIEKFGLKSEEEVKKYLGDFQKDLILRLKKRHESLEDYARHFCDWLDKRRAKGKEKLILVDNVMATKNKTRLYGEQKSINREFLIPKSSFDEFGNCIYDEN